MGTVIIFLLVALVVVLVAGIVLMGMGGKANEKYGNKLMRARVYLQGAVLVMLVLVFMVGHN